MTTNAIMVIRPPALRVRSYSDSGEGTIAKTGNGHLCAYDNGCIFAFCVRVVVDAKRSRKKTEKK